MRTPKFSLEFRVHVCGLGARHCGHSYMYLFIYLLIRNALAVAEKTLGSTAGREKNRLSVAPLSAVQLSATRLSARELGLGRSMAEELLRRLAAMET